MQKIININSCFAVVNDNLFSVVSPLVLGRNEEKEKVDFQAEKGTKQCRTANIWYHLSLDWTEREKKLYQREQRCIRREKKEMAQLVFAEIKYLPFRSLSASSVYLCSVFAFHCPVNNDAGMMPKYLNLPNSLASCSRWLPQVKVH